LNEDANSEHWAAIRAELTICRSDAIALLTHNVKSPLYRFPVTALKTAFPILLAEGQLNEEQVHALTLYFEHIQDLNRGLDHAAEFYARGDGEHLTQEHKRNLVKAEFLLGKTSEENVLEGVKNIVDGKLLRWRQLL
jgi:hypothetical protein